MVLQYDIYPQIGLQFGPLIFMITVLGGLGNMIGGFVASFIISPVHRRRLAAASPRNGATRSPSCSSWPPSSSGRRACSGASHEPADPAAAYVSRPSRAAGAAAGDPAVFARGEKYYLHLLIQILLWAFIYTGWSLMGRFGLTSLGHGAFTGIGAYVTVLLWNFAGITPWLGIPVGIALAMIAGAARRLSLLSRAASPATISR